MNLFSRSTSFISFSSCLLELFHFIHQSFLIFSSFLVSRSFSSFCFDSLLQKVAWIWLHLVPLENNKHKKTKKTKTRQIATQNKIDSTQEMKLIEVVPVNWSFKLNIHWAIKWFYLKSHQIVISSYRSRIKRQYRQNFDSNWPEIWRQILTF